MALCSMACPLLLFCCCFLLNICFWASLVEPVVKNLLTNAGDAGDSSSIWSGRSPGEENGTPPQYSCLENPMDRGAQQVKVHGSTKSRTPLSGHKQGHTVQHRELQSVFHKVK